MDFFDRDLSWLSFNKRLLMEAEDTSVPLLERLKFLAIYSSNLDEFFRVRVADVRSLMRIDKKKINKELPFTPSELLAEIHKETAIQLQAYGNALEKVYAGLKENGIVICQHVDDIPEDLKSELLSFFKSRIAPFLKPKVHAEEEEIFFNNGEIYFIFKFDDGQFGHVKIPSSQLKRFYVQKADGLTYCVFVDDIVRLHFDLIFPGKQIENECTIKLNKDADLLIDDEYSGDLVDRIERQIEKRNLGLPARFLYDSIVSRDLLDYFSKKLELEQDDMVAGGRYHNLNDYFQLTGIDPTLAYDKLSVVPHGPLENTRSLFEVIRESDQLLHFPYQSYDHIIRFFAEASLDPSVHEINVTFYRMAKDSLIGASLVSAAKNGKKVNVFMEVKARFDEANNLKWAKKLKKAGADVYYSKPGLKVHAKVALVKSHQGDLAFLGTGNLNEGTAGIYADHGLLSSSADLTSELSSVFEFLTEDKHPGEFQHLIVSQFGAIEKFDELIDREIDHAKVGKKAEIIVKVNNLQEAHLIEKLYKAAEKGVEVKCIIRSICCLVPGTNGIEVKRIVDRYLEHARIFYFHNDGKKDVYIGSSDWMNRNLHRRVEVTFPIRDSSMKEQFEKILELNWNDDVKGVWLSEQLENIPISEKKGVQAQLDIHGYLSEGGEKLNSRL